MADGNKSENPCKIPIGGRIQDYQILKKLGEGSFGAVYQVIRDNDVYAMKVESVTEDESMIKMEVAILKTFRNSIWRHPHVCDYVDSGMTSKIRYVVMKLCGPNLSDVRRQTPNNQFSESTTVRLGIQGVRALQSLHRIGFIHRDVKPQNLAIGLGRAQRTIFLLDFGLARQYVDRLGRLRPPRKQAGFRGTVRYCSLNSHLRKDLGRHDDLWSLLYMLVELQKGKLPWRKSNDKNEVAKMKRLAVADILLEGMAREFHAFMNELHGLHFSNTPDYEYFCQQLRSIMRRRMYSDEEPFDWDEDRSVYTRLRKAMSERLVKAKKKEENQVKKGAGQRRTTQFTSPG